MHALFTHVHTNGRGALGATGPSSALQPLGGALGSGRRFLVGLFHGLVEAKRRHKSNERERERMNTPEREALLLHLEKFNTFLGKPCAFGVGFKKCPLLSLKSSNAAIFR